MLTNCDVETKIEIAWGDMDALGHVNNVNYFRYFETARIDYFNRIGLNDVTPNAKVGPILANISCQFKLPIIFPDNITIGTSVTKVGNTSFKIYHEIYSEQFNTVAATGESIIVLVNYKSGEKVSIPEDIRALIAKQRKP